MPPATASKKAPPRKKGNKPSERVGWSSTVSVEVCKSEFVTAVGVTGASVGLGDDSGTGVLLGVAV